MVICTFFLFIFILRWLLPFQHYFSFYIWKEKSNDGREISVLVIPLRLIFFSFLFRYTHTSSLCIYTFMHTKDDTAERETRAQPPAQPMKLQKRRWKKKKINKKFLINAHTRIVGICLETPKQQAFNIKRWFPISNCDGIFQLKQIRDKSNRKKAPKKCG